jgi:hypothetical protein
VDIECERVEQMRFGDGSAVRAASAVTALGNGFVVVQDDATHAAWFVDGGVTALRLLPPVEGHDLFEAAAGTKHLKPDLEAACEVRVDGRPAVLMLGSGSSPVRTRAALVRLEDGRPSVVSADLAPLYAAAAEALSVRPDELNLEGACVAGGVLRWFHRGLPSAGVPPGSVAIEVSEVVDATLGRADAESVAVTSPRHYDLGDVAGVGLAVTDVVTLPDGTMLASAVAEDSPNARDDGPVVGSALVRLAGDQVRDVTPLPTVGGHVSKVEGLTALPGGGEGLRLLAVVDADDPTTPSLALHLRVLDPSL